MDKLGYFLGSFFYLGRLPAAGTWGSAAGALLAWYFPEQAFSIFIAVTILGYACSFIAKKSFGTKDPGEFILDEVSGMMLSVLWAPRTLAFYAGAFLLFRFFDIKKPGFIRSLDKMDHPTSIMNDDIAAGLVTAALLAIAQRLC